MAVFFYGCVSLDGYLATSGHNLDWLHETGTTEDTGYDEFYARMDVTLMGRRTFAKVAKLDDPASAYPTTKNFVFTHGELDCPGFTGIAEDPVAFVEKLEPGRNIWVVGGNTILKPLLECDMVDRLIVQVAPVLLGVGIPLFAQAEALHRFTLEAVNRYGQFAELVYSRGGGLRCGDSVQLVKLCSTC